MADSKIERLIKRFDCAKNQRDEMRSIYDIAYRLSVPDRNTFSGKITPGSRNDVGLYD